MCSIMQTNPFERGVWTLAWNKRQEDHELDFVTFCCPEYALGPSRYVSRHPAAFVARRPPPPS